MNKKKTIILKSPLQQSANYTGLFRLLPDNTNTPIISQQPFENISQNTWIKSETDTYQRIIPSTDILTAIKGTNISFSVYASNYIPQIKIHKPTNLKYIWYLNRSPLSALNNLNNNLGTNKVTITNESCTPQASGEYVCEIINDFGSIETEPFTLDIVDPQNHPKLYKNLIDNGNGEGGLDGWVQDGSIIVHPFVKDIQRTQNFSSFRLGGITLTDYGKSTTSQIRPPFYFSNASHVGMFLNTHTKRQQASTTGNDYNDQTKKVTANGILTNNERYMSEGYLPQIIPNEDYNKSISKSIAGFFPGIMWIDEYNKNESALSLSNEFYNQAPLYFTRNKIRFKNKGGAARASLTQTIDLSSLASMIDGNAYGITHTTSQFFAYVGAGITNYEISFTNIDGTKEKYNYYIGTTNEYRERFEANYSNTSASYGITSYYLDTTLSPPKWLSYNEMIKKVPQSEVNTYLTTQQKDVTLAQAQFTDLTNIKNIIIAATTVSSPENDQGKVVTPGNYSGNQLLRISKNIVSSFITNSENSKIRNDGNDYIVFKYNASYPWSTLSNQITENSSPAVLLPDDYWPFWIIYKKLLLLFKSKIETYFNYKSNTLDEIITAAINATPTKTTLNQRYKGFNISPSDDWKKYYKDTQGGGDYNSEGADHIKNNIHPLLTKGNTAVVNIINDISTFISTLQDTAEKIKKAKWIFNEQRSSSQIAQIGRWKKIKSGSNIEIKPILNDQTVIELIYFNENNNIIRKDAINGPDALDVWAIKEKVYFPLTLYPLFEFTHPNTTDNISITVFNQKYTTVQGLAGFFTLTDTGLGTGPFEKGINSLDADSKITLDTVGLNNILTEDTVFGYSGADKLIRDKNAQFLMNKYDFKSYGATYPPETFNVNPGGGKSNSHRAVHDFGAAAMFGVELTARMPKGARSVQIKVTFTHTSDAFEDLNPEKRNWTRSEIYNNEYGSVGSTVDDNKNMEYGNPRCGITAMKYIIAANNFEKSTNYPSYYIPPLKSTVLGLQKQKYTDPNAFNTIDIARFTYQPLFPTLPTEASTTDLYTKGDKYQLNNGTIYVGYYHIHKDKGPMVGAKHTESSHEYLYPIT